MRDDLKGLISLNGAMAIGILECNGNLLQKGMMLLDMVQSFNESDEIEEYVLNCANKQFQYIITAIIEYAIIYRPSFLNGQTQKRVKTCFIK